MVRAKDFWGSENSPRDTVWRAPAIAHFPKCLECTPPGVSPQVPSALGRQGCPVADSSVIAKAPPEGGTLIMGRLCVGGAERGGHVKISAPSAQFCCEPELL